jgi:NAD-dependent dihydropyrimidine dehydrogenase PreA subunit
MTLKKVYSCDICTIDKPQHVMLGLKIYQSSKIKIVEVHEADRHLCTSCLQELKDLSPKDER